MGDSLLLAVAISLLLINEPAVLCVGLVADEDEVDIGKCILFYLFGV